MPGALPTYNLSMARGWDSKSVEEQLEAATATRDQALPENENKRSPEQLQSIRERKNLELARTKVMGQLNASQNPRYTEMLNRALRDLDRRLASFK